MMSIFFFFFQIIPFIFIGLGIFLYLVLVLGTKDKSGQLTPKSSNFDFCVLIPARDESAVIENLFLSLKRQTLSVSFSDVYVIVEDKQDKTVEIAKRYQVNVLYRENLARQRKGYALDEAIRQIILRKEYDAYFIFDADNVLDDCYFEEMKKTYLEGYDIGIGYRNCKNGNVSVFASCSALTFSMINTLSNERKQNNNNTLTLSGTGFYITGNFIHQWGGYPFHSLTEDYELTLYATLHHLKMYYNKNACFFDEQPTTYRVTKNQRVRWIKGYFEARKKYLPSLRQELKKNPKNRGSLITELIGVCPFICFIVGIFLFFIIQTINCIFNKISIFSFFVIAIFTLIVIYLGLVFVTGYMIRRENHKLSLTKISKIKALFFNPIYLVTYLFCAIKALMTKNVSWVKIEHKDNFSCNH